MQEELHLMRFRLGLKDSSVWISKCTRNTSFLFVEYRPTRYTQDVLASESSFRDAANRIGIHQLRTSSDAAEVLEGGGRGIAIPKNLSSLDIYVSP